MGRSSGKRRSARRIGFFLVVSLIFFAPTRLWVSGNVAAQERVEPAEAVDPSSVSLEMDRGRSFFWHVVYSVGPVFGPLMLCFSVGLSALIITLAVDLRHQVAMPAAFIEEFTDTINERQFKAAFHLARLHPSSVARILAAGMGRLEFGMDEVRVAVAGTVARLKASRQQLISFLSTTGVLGTLVGLIGTIFSAVRLFGNFGVAGKSYHGDYFWAESLSQILVSILLGVSLLVPALFFRVFFQNRLNLLMIDLNNVADDLLTQIYYNSKKPIDLPDR